LIDVYRNIPNPNVIDFVSKVFDVLLTTCIVTN